MIVITDISALEVWNALDIADAKVSRVRRPRGGPRPETDSELGFIHALRLSSPIHLLVDAASKRLASDDFVVHVSGEMPSRSLVDMEDEVYVSTPEHAFARISKRLTRAQIQLLAMELCGSYSTLGLYESGGFMERKPVTTKRRLSDYLGRYYGETYAVRALSKLDCISDCSASPMESIVELLLCNPYRYGGYGFKPPIMNNRVDLQNDLQLYAGKTHYKCDLMWPDEKTAIEYDSNAYHTRADAIHRDAIRRNILEYAGFHVITVTNAQVRNPIAFEGIALQLSHYLKKRIVLPDSFLQSSTKLRKELFSVMPWQIHS